MAERVVAKRRIVAFRHGVTRPASDQLAGEEPMEIRVDGQSVAVTMRTPGNDFELAVGFCLTEGLLDGPDDLAAARYCPRPGEEQRYNVVDVGRRAPRPVSAELTRNVYTSSSCGVCGTSSIELVRKATPEVSADDVHIDAAVLAALPERLRAEQRVFDRTGGLHAAGLFSATGEVLCVREDVGRHNAVDKVIGWAVTESRLPLTGCVLLVSGRVAFEIVQKALFASVPVVAAVSAPTSLAASLAEEAGVTLVGFVRDGDLNVYCHPERVLA